MVYYSERLHVECGVRRATHRAGRHWLPQVVGLSLHAARQAAGRRGSGPEKDEVLSPTLPHHFVVIASERRPQREGRPCAGRQLPSQNFPEFEDWAKPPRGRQWFHELHPHRLAESHGLEAHGAMAARSSSARRVTSNCGNTSTGARDRRRPALSVDHKGEHHIRCHGEVVFPASSSSTVSTAPRMR